jgi:hypothetical protein
VVVLQETTRGDGLLWLASSLFLKENTRGDSLGGLGYTIILKSPTTSGDGLLWFGGDIFLLLGEARGNSLRRLRHDTSLK